jgi:hypothetical protein
MIRAFIPLCVGALCSVGVGRQVAAVSPAITAAAVAPAPVNCDKPTEPTMAPAPSSETDMISQMEAWWAQKEAISQMEAWWRQRTELGHAMAREPAPPVLHRRRRDYSISSTEFGCPPSGCLTPYHPGLGGSIKAAHKREFSDDELSAIGWFNRH